MAKAIIARRKGDEYQARVFWSHALKLRTDDHVELVEFESDQVSFMDDVLVGYRPPIRERETGRHIELDCFQCKYHMTSDGAFNCENLLNPDFINSTTRSMLGRMHAAFRTLSGRGQPFRINVVSNYFWDTGDFLALHLHEGLIRDSFYEGSPRTTAGRVRQRLAEHLQVDEQQLKSFLSTVRFVLGKNLGSLADELVPLLRLAGLRAIDPCATNIEYDDLAWKLFEQGRNWFDRPSFDAMVRDERLLEVPKKNHSEISIRSCLQFARRPDDTQAMLLDLTALFDGRFPRSASTWAGDIPRLLKEFLLEGKICSLPQPICLFFDCHLSIAFAAGYLLDPKFGLQIVPVQKNPRTGYEIWPRPAGKRNDVWEYKSIGKVGREAIVAVSVTHPVEQHLAAFLEGTPLARLPRLCLAPRDGIGPQAVRDGDHAWHLGYGLQVMLRNALPATCNTLHVFLAGPAALAYIIGNTMRGVAPSIQLYEHDFEGGDKAARYYPSLALPLDC